jgi:hypothetical protein
VRDDTPKAVRQRATTHLREHHDMSNPDEKFIDRMDTLAIITIR